MRIFLIMITVFLLVACQTNSEKEVIDSVNEVSQIDFNDPNNVLLDVRTAEEFQAGNIPNSVNIDFNSQEFDSLIKDLDPNKTYYVYCQGGVRSPKACSKLNEKGFKNVVNLKDGFKEYKK
jgi:rhodanese-related sulfurtransferase